jgi:hypothetical protein
MHRWLSPQSSYLPRLPTPAWEINGSRSSILRLTTIYVGKVALEATPWQISPCRRQALFLSPFCAWIYSSTCGHHRADLLLGSLFLVSSMPDPAHLWACKIRLLFALDITGSLDTGRDFLCRSRLKYCHPVPPSRPFYPCTFVCGNNQFSNS